MNWQPEKVLQNKSASLKDPVAALHCACCTEIFTEQLSSTNITGWRMPVNHEDSRSFLRSRCLPVSLTQVSFATLLFFTMQSSGQCQLSKDCLKVTHCDFFWRNPQFVVAISSWPILASGHARISTLPRAERTGHLRQKRHSAPHQA